MLELMSYGLAGMAAMVVVASGFAYREEFSLRGKRSIDQTDRALGLLSWRSGETSTGTLHSGVSTKSVPREAFHG